MNKKRPVFKGIYNRYSKRIFDVTGAIILIFLLFPVFLLISLIILIKTGIPVIYKGERGGYMGKSFTIYKFRTMVKDASKYGGTSALNDARITSVGKVLRRTKLDEIPQLFNIIKGDMSFVGPRPELLQYTSLYEGEEKLILSVRPGITDFSSIEFINLDEIVGETDVDFNYESYVLPKKNQLRIRYATTVSFRTDIKILLLTIVKVANKIVHIIGTKKTSL